MDTDSEREPSSSPNADTSSEGKSYHDEDLDDSSDGVENDMIADDDIRVESAEENAVSVVEVNRHKSAIKSSNIVECPLEVGDVAKAETDLLHTQFSHSQAVEITTSVSVVSETLKTTCKSISCSKLNKLANMQSMEDMATNIGGAIAMPTTRSQRPSIFEEQCNISVDTESTKPESECYFSAQDFLEYGALAAHDTRTPDIESGYYERSESDISRDDTAEQLRQTKSSPSRQIKCRSADHGLFSEGLREELNRFRAMIEIMERERVNNNNTDESLQQAVENVLNYEQKYIEQKANLENENNTNESEIETEFNLNNKIDRHKNQRGYWSTVFGQASPIETGVELTLDERFADIQSNRFKI